MSIPGYFPVPDAFSVNYATLNFALPASHFVGNLFANEGNQSVQNLSITRYTDSLGDPVSDFSIDLNGDVSIPDFSALNSLGAGVTQIYSIKYTVTNTLDNNLSDSSGRLEISVTGINDAPVAVADNYNYTPGTDLNMTVLSNDTDADTGDTKTIVALRSADGSITDTTPADGLSITTAAGTVSLNADGSLKFHPAAGFAGPTSFQYTIQDLGGLQSTATVNLVPPVTLAATNDTLSTNEDTALIINPLSNDIGTSITKIQITSLPANAGLQLNGVAVTVNQEISVADINANKLNFNPALNFNGSSSFQYKISDGTVFSAPATVTVAVNAVNDAPVRTAGTLTAIAVNEDSATTTAASLGLSGLTYGPGGGTAEAAQTLTYKITAVPNFMTLWKADGTAVLANSTLTGAELQGLHYKTVADANGSGSISWSVTDSGSGTSPNVNTISESLSVSVAAINDAPVRTAGTLTAIAVNEDSATTTAASLGLSGLTYGPGGGTAEAAQTLTYKITAVPGFMTLWKADGTAVLANSTLTGAELQGLHYKTVVDANGSGSISWSVTDSGSGTSPNVNTISESLSVSVAAVNDAPVAVNDTASVDQDANASGNLLTNDHDPDQGDTQTLVGASLVGGGIFAADVTDTFGSLHVNPDGSFSFTANGADSDALAARVTHVDSFEYQIRDAAGLTSNAQLSITITGVNDAPVAVDDTLEVTAGQSQQANLLSNDSDPDQGDTLYGVVSASLNDGPDTQIGIKKQFSDGYGVLSIISAGIYTFKADGLASQALGAGATHVETVRYTIQDSNQATATAQALITITGVNDGPTAVDDTVGVNDDTTTTLALLANDTDPDTDDHLQVTGFRQSGTDPFVSTLTDAYGTLTLAADGTVSFVANGAASEALAVGATATDTFSYQISDDAGSTATASLTLTITGVNNAPTANDDAYSYNNTAGSVFTVTAANGVLQHVDAGETADDTDPDNGDTLTVEGAGTSLTTTAGQHVTFAADGSFVYDAVDGFYGHDSFSYTASDGHGGSSTATVNLSVAAPPKLADKFLINEIAVNTGPATFTITTDNGADPNTVTTGVAHIEIIKNINTATSSADLRSMQVEIVNPNGDLSIVSMSQLVGLTVDKNGAALNLSSAIAAGGSLELFEPNSSGLGIWAVYDSKGTLKSSGTYHDNAWQLGADVSAPIAVNLAQAGASLDLFIANGAPISDLHGIDTAQSWLSGVGTLGTAPHALGSVSPFVLPEKLFAWYGGAQLLPAGVPADVAELLVANQQFNASLASSSDTVFARVYDHYLSNANGTGTDKVFIDSNDAGDWTYGPKAILTDGTENTVGKGDGSFVANPLDPYDNVNPMQGNGQHGDVIALITNEDGQTIAVYSGLGLGGSGHDFLYGVNTDDLLYGGGENDFIYGSGGNDLLFGGSGGDHLLGGLGNDVLSGDSGNDSLEGGDDCDVLAGGIGKDVLSGGTGNDSFLYLAVNESAAGAEADVISDFVHGSDKIDLSVIDARTAVSGNQAFAFGGNTVAVQANAVTWYESGGNTIVQIDNSGNNVADMQLVLTGIGLGLSATDFVL